MGASIRRGNRAGVLQNLGTRGLGHSRPPLSRQFEEHAQPVVETFLVVSRFPFLESALPRLALSTKRLCHILVQPASRIRSPSYPHRWNIRSTSLEKPITFQHAPVRTLKQCCFPWHGITSVSSSLQISIQANRGSIVTGTVEPSWTFRFADIISQNNAGSSLMSV